MDTVTLEGSARDLGRQVGALSRRALRERYISLLGEESEWPDILAAHADRLGAYRDLVARFVPHWLEEVEGLAEGAGVPAAALLLVNSASAESLTPKNGDCSAFMAIGSASGCGANLLHKTRDNRPDPQLFFARHIQGTYRVLGGIEVGGLGLAQMVNEHGLAGANNTGSRLSSQSPDVGFDDRQVLRMVGEQARSCEEALAICERMVDAHVARGDAGRYGMIFVFADPRRGLVVEMTESGVWHEFCDDGLVCRSNHFLIDGAKAAALPPDEGGSTVLRHARAEELLRPLVGRLEPADFIAAARDTAHHPFSVCNDKSVSTATHVLAADPARRVSYVVNGYPLVAPVREWPHSEVATPVEYLDGTLWTPPPAS